MAKKEEQPKVNGLISKQGTILVTSTLMGKTTQKGEVIEVRPFVTATASVEIHKGFWLPTGDMAGAKVDVTIMMPCYVEEISSTYAQVNRLVEALVEKEMNRMQGEGK